MIGDLQVRNAGTIGGNIAHADPASDLPTVLLALEAKMHAMGPRGQRSIPASEFFEGMMTTSLGPDEILTSVEVPSRQAGQGMAYVKFGHPASRYAVIGCCGNPHGQGRHVHGCSCRDWWSAACCDPAARQLNGLSKGQRGSATDISRIAGEVKGVLNDVLGDIYASADARSAMAPVYVERALTSALARARWSQTPAMLPASIDDLQALLERQLYVADRSLAVSVYLALRLRRPLFVEGEAGVERQRLRKRWLPRSKPS